MFCLFFKFKLNITHKNKNVYIKNNKALNHTIMKRTEARSKSCLL